MKRLSVGLGLFLSTWVLASCSSTDPEVASGGRTAAIVLFSASAEAVEAEQPVTISWVTLGASEFSLTAGGVAIPVESSRWGNGSVTLNPTAPTLVRLEVKGEFGEPAVAEKEIDLIVLPSGLIDEFKAEPAIIAEGASTTLSWKTSTTTAIRITDAVGNAVDLEGVSRKDGSVTVSPPATTTYTMVAEGQGGGSEASVSVTVVPPPTLSVEAAPTTVIAGEPSTLTWTTTDANRVVVRVDDEILLDTEEKLSSELEVKPIFSTIYTVEVFGVGGHVSATAAVSTTPKIADFSTPDPLQVRVGMLVNLAWTTLGANQLILSNGDGFTVEITGAEAASGTRKAPVGQSGTFTLRALNGVTEVSQTLAFTVVDRPVIADLQVVTGPVTAGPDHPADVVVSWVASGARSLLLRAIPGEVISLAGKSLEADEITVPVRGLTTFELYAENVAGEDVRRVDAVVVAPPAIGRFRALPTRVGQGASTTIAWETTDAERIVLEQDGTPVAEVKPSDFDGSLDVQLVDDADFTLRAFNSLGFEVFADLTVTVGSPAIESFTPDRAWYPVGGTIVLSWASDGGTSLTIVGPGGATIHSTQDLEAIQRGSISLTAPTQVGEASYRLTISNESGEDSETLDLTITEAPMIELFSVSPGKISAGDRLEFRWDVTNDAFGATPVLTLRDNADNTYPMVGTDPNEGVVSFKIPTAGAYVFTLHASTGGTRFSEATASATVIALPEIVTLKATPEFASSEFEPTILQWQTLHATRLQFFRFDDDGVLEGEPFFITDAQVADGTRSFQPYFDAPHVRLIAENELGARTTRDLRVGVNPATVTSFEADPDTILRGEASRLSWTTERATSVELVVAPWVEIDAEFLDLSTRPTASRLVFAAGDFGIGKLPFPEDFTFPYDNKLHRAVMVTNTGYLSFDLLRTNGVAFNVPIIHPDSRWVPVHIMPFQTEYLDRSAQNGEIWYEFIGTGAERSLVVQFKRMSIDGHLSALLNFQAVLHADGSFEYRYGDMSSPSDPSLAEGAVAAIGYRNLSGTKGMVFSQRAPVPGGLSHRSFYFPVVSRLMEVRESTESESFIDIAGAGIKLIEASGDPLNTFQSFKVDPLPEGFVFPFGGKDRTGVWVMRDGYIHFSIGESLEKSSRTSNVELARGYDLFEATYVHIAPFWNYLTPAYRQGEIWMAVREDDRGRFLVIQWSRFSKNDFSAQDSNLNFQVLLREDGTFEYRYGGMDGGSKVANANGSLATIGWQEANGVKGVNVFHKQVVPGGMSNRGWFFDPNPALPLNGHFDVNPGGPVEYTLIARNERSSHRATTFVDTHEKATARFWSEPEQPRPGQPFTVHWHSLGLLGLTIEEADGGAIVGQFAGTTKELRHGSLEFPVGRTMGTHHFVGRGTGGYPGDTIAENFEVLVYDPYSIDAFAPSEELIRVGEKITLSWATTNAHTLELEAIPGGPIDISGTGRATGSVEHAPQQTTVYKLTAQADGRRTSKEVTVEVRTITIDEFEMSSSNVIGGAPVTLTWKTDGEGATYWSNDNYSNGNPPEYFMMDVTDSSPYVDIEGQEGTTTVTAINSDTTAATVPLPFSFSYYDEPTLVSSVRVSPRGLINLRNMSESSLNTSSNTRFPDFSTAGSVTARMAVFWDTLNPDGVGKVLTRHVKNADGPDAFVIQWKRMKFHHTTAASRFGDLNFQIVLYEDGTFEYRYGLMSGIHNGQPPTEVQAIRAMGGGASVGFQPGLSLYHAGQQLSYRTPSHNGGFQNRSYRFVPSNRPLPASGTIKLAPLQTTDYEMCAVSETWRECKTFRIVVPQPGHLMITELQIDPRGPNPTQWFEVRNLTLDPIDLEGMTIVAGPQTIPISTGKPLLLQPKSYAVFSAAPTTSFESLFVYGTALDLKTVTSLELRSNGVPMAKASWNPLWLTVGGASLSLDTSLQRVGTVEIPGQASWCESRTAYDLDNLGSPGGHGVSCGSQHYDVDYLSNRPFIDIEHTGVRVPEVVSRFNLAHIPLAAGFSFPYFGGIVQTNDLWAHPYGVITFSKSKEAGVSGDAPGNLETTPAKRVFLTDAGMIAAHWHDDPQPRSDGTSGVHVERTAIDGKEVFIIQWTRFSRWYSNNKDGELQGHLTYQIQIWENGDIVLAYDDVLGAYFTGVTAAVGIVGPNGTDYMQYFYQQPYLAPKQSVLYKKK